MAKLSAMGSYKITPVAQSNENTCWLACYQMMYQSIDRTKGELEGFLKKAGIDMTVTLKDAQQETAGKAVGFVSAKSAVLTDFKTLRRYMETYGVLKISISVNDSGHAIVVVGVDPDTEQVYVINPWSEDWTAERSKDVKVRPQLFSQLKLDMAGRKDVKGSLQYYDAAFE